MNISNTGILFIFFFINFLTPIFNLTKNPQLQINTNFTYKLKIHDVGIDKEISPYLLEDFCIGTPRQCFSLILTFIGSQTLIIDKQATSTAGYDSLASISYVEDNLFLSEIDFFGSVTYKNSNDTIYTKTAELKDFPFHNIIKLNTLPVTQVKANGVLGLGYGSPLLKLLKNAGFIKNAIYSYNYETQDETTYLNIALGEMVTGISSNENVTYCQITSNEKLISYWGCTTDIHVNLSGNKFSLLSQPVIIGVNQRNTYDGELIFAGMREKYQSFIYKALLNSTKCSIDNSTNMFECDKSFDYKNGPNLQLVMNEYSYVFKLNDLFVYNQNKDKYVLKISFPENKNDYSHIIINRNYLMKNKISVVYDDENQRIGLLGFHTHKYQGELDDGDTSDNQGLTFYVVLIMVILILGFITGAVYGIYVYIKKRERHQNIFSSLNN
jgi:hypothetical protein